MVCDLHLNKDITIKKTRSLSSLLLWVTAEPASLTKHLSLSSLNFSYPLCSLLCKEPQLFSSLNVLLKPSLGAELYFIHKMYWGLPLSSQCWGWGPRSPAGAHTAAHLRPSAGITGSWPGSMCAQHFLMGVMWLTLLTCFWCSFPTATAVAGSCLIPLYMFVPKTDICT